MKTPDIYIQKIYKKYRVPKNIRAHMKAVARVALKLGKAIQKKGQPIKLRELKTAALLHDIVKLCDFAEVDFKKIPHKPTKMELKTWRRYIKKYHVIGHAEAGYQIVKKYNQEVAVMIKKHGYKSLIAAKKKDRPTTIEEKILYYADKRVKHDKMVTLKERISDGQKRYFPNGKIPSNDKKIQKALFVLEKELLKTAVLKNI